MELIQFIFSETDEAAKEIVDAVIPVADKATKEDIAEAAVDKAEEIADEAVDEQADDEVFSAVVETIAQSIYTQTMAEIAVTGSLDNLETLFSEEDLEDYYSALDDIIQEAYAEAEAEEEYYAGKKLGRFKRMGNHIKGNPRAYTAAATGAAGVAGGALIGDRIARKRGTSRRKGQIIGALVGGTAGAGAGYGGTALYQKFGKKKK